MGCNATQPEPGVGQGGVRRGLPTPALFHNTPSPESVIAPRTRRLLQGVLEYNAATHDHIEVLSLTAQDPKILKGVAVDEQEVRECARLQHA